MIENEILILDIIAFEWLIALLAVAVFFIVGGFVDWSSRRELRSLMARQHPPAAPAWHHLSADDPPIWLSYTGPVTDAGEGIHSSRFGVIFKDRADEVGVPCYIRITKSPDLYPKPPDMWEFLYGVLMVDTAKPTP